MEYVKIKNNSSQEWTRQHTLTSEQLKKLLQNKLDRANIAVQAMKRKHVIK